MTKYAIKLKLAATFFVLLLLAHGAFAAQEGLTKRVRFGPGRTTATLKNSVVRGERHRYTLGARAGQKMSVSITSIERNAVFTIYTPDGGTLEGAGEGADASQWSGALPASGDYIIEVGGTRGNASYTLKLKVR